MSQRNEIIEAFYKDNYRELCKRVAGRAGGMYNAEDVVQEAFSRAIKYWPSFTPGKHELGAWFNTIVANSLTNFTREEKSYGTCVEFDEDQCDGVPMSQCDQHTREALYRIASQMSPKHKEIVMLSLRFGYTRKEISEVLDIPVGGVKIVLERFRAEAKEKLKVA